MTKKKANKNNELLIQIKNNNGILLFLLNKKTYAILLLRTLNMESKREEEIKLGRKKIILIFFDSLIFRK